jgi:hypothetical protein
MHSHQSAEFAGTKPRFEGLLSKVFEEMTKETKISEVIAQLSLVVAMLETEKFESPSFYDTTEVKECRGELEEGAEERMLKAVDSFIRVESEKLHIQSMEDLRARLDHREMKRQHILLHDGIVERAKVLMKGQCCAYLHSFSVSNDDVNQKVGTVRCSITYGRSLQNGDEIEPWRESGLSLTLRLPHNGHEGIVNSMYSLTVAAYLKMTWMGKFSLWCHSIVDLLETALDMQIEANNQFSESLMKNVKYNQDVYKHVSEPADYILHRAEDCGESAKQFIHQYEQLHGSINQLISRRAKRQRADESNKSNLALTQDELTQQTEEVETEQWKRRGGAKESESQLRSELVEVLSAETNLENNNTKWHKYIESFIGKSQISYSTFRSFMKNELQSQLGLNQKHQKALQDFVDMKRKDRVDSSA